MTDTATIPMCTSPSSHTPTVPAVPAVPAVRVAAGAAQGAAEPTPQALAFQNAWQQHISPKLTQLFGRLALEPEAVNLALAQAWTYLPVLTEGSKALKTAEMCLTNRHELIDFQMHCRNTGVQLGFLGPMGKVWENGSVQVVQCVDSLPPECHPCDRLKGPLMSHIAEIIYIPIYDTDAAVSGGVLAVLELMICAGSHDPQVVANTIACVARILDSLALHLSSSGSGAPCALPSSGPPSPSPRDRVGSTRRCTPPVMRVSAPPAPISEPRDDPEPPRSSSAGRMMRTRSLLVIRPILC